MPGYTYATFKAALGAEMNVSGSSTAFNAILPTIIDQAEGMIYREPDLDFLSSVVTNGSGSATPNQREFTLPQHFTVLHDVSRIDGNLSTPLIKMSRDALEMLYSQTIANTVGDVPTTWAPLTDQVIMLGPCPGFAVQLVCTGEAQPAPLSDTNTVTWLSQYLPDLFFAAAMLFASAAQKNFGAQADNPQMAVSWRSTYDALLPGAKSQEMRRKHAATGGAV